MTPKEIVEYYEEQGHEALREIDERGAYRTIETFIKPDAADTYWIDTDGAVKMVIDYLPDPEKARLRWIDALMYVLEIDQSMDGQCAVSDLYYLATATDSEKLAACLIVLAEEEEK